MLTRTLRLIPNPYAAIDHKGRCAGACTEAPDWRNSADTHVRYIGATRTVKVQRAENPRRRVSEIADHAWSFSTEPVLVDASDATDYKHYRHALLTGEVLAADKETADVVGVAWADPFERLAHMREAHNVTPEPKAQWEPLLKEAARRLLAKAEAKAQADAELERARAEAKAQADAAKGKVDAERAADAQLQASLTGNTEAAASHEEH